MHSRTPPRQDCSHALPYANCKPRRWSWGSIHRSRLHAVGCRPAARVRAALLGVVLFVCLSWGGGGQEGVGEGAPASTATPTPAPWDASGTFSAASVARGSP